VRSDGTQVQTLLYANPEQDFEGRVVGTRALFVDVTERKRLEEQLRRAQKIEAIGTLAGGIAHDFNNLLMPITAHVELLLLQLPQDSPGRENLKQVLHAAERGADLVQQILAISRGEEQQRQPVGLHVLTQEAMKLLRAATPATIEIREEIDPSSGCVLADLTQMHQMVMNLCTNANQAMRKKGGVLGVRVDCVEVGPQGANGPLDLPPGSYVRLTVRDTGQGMDAETRERIFDPYFTTKGVGEGSGLGLAVTHGIVAAHGGGIHVESELGKGSTFQVYLPQLTRDVPPGPPGPTVGPRGTERVLFVDDEPAVAKVAEKMLAYLGYQVTALTSGVEALERFRAAPSAYDLVVTDQIMPRMSGADLAREMLAIRPELPIIICTGRSEVLGGDRARGLGAKAMLTKPLAWKQLAETVREALDRV
jgi:signal transduction histidine kinase